MEVVLKNVSFSDSSLTHSKHSFLPAASNIGVDTNSKSRRTLLESVSVTLGAGSVTALYGFGNGPSSLLNVVGLQQATSGHIAGSLLFDNSIRSPGPYSDIAFVTKKYTNCFLELTVFDFLYWSARLRVTHGAIECRSEIICIFFLTIYLYSLRTFFVYRNRATEAAKLIRLDSSLKLANLKNDQLRLLSIGSELVSNPTLICLDDPFAGLDEISALVVVSTLSRIAKRQHAPTTIVFSVRQPGHCLLKAVNRLVIFADSSVIFSRDISFLSMASPRAHETNPTLSPATRFSSTGCGSKELDELRYIEDQIASKLSAIESQLAASELERRNNSDIIDHNIQTLSRSMIEYCRELSNHLSDLTNETEMVGVFEPNQTPQLNDDVHSPLRGTNDASSVTETEFVKPKSRRQVHYGSLTRMPKKTMEEALILISRTKSNQISNVRIYYQYGILQIIVYLSSFFWCF